MNTKTFVSIPLIDTVTENNILDAAQHLVGQGWSIDILLVHIGESESLPYTPDPFSDSRISGVMDIPVVFTPLVDPGALHFFGQRIY